MAAETIDEEESDHEEDTSNFMPPDATTALAPQEIDEAENDRQDQTRKLSFISVSSLLTVFLSHR
jgi:hypothetical protein